MSRFDSLCVPILRCAAAAAAIVCGPALAAQKGISNATPYALTTATQVIASGGPLREIHLGNELSAQIAHIADSAYEVYPPGTIPGDFGTLLVVADRLYAPDFAGHGITATANLGSYTPFTPQNQTSVSGSGSEADPYKVTTIVSAGATGLTLTQVDSYVAGFESYRSDITISNTGSGAISAILYRAMDCYLGGSDSGYGQVGGNNVACMASPTSGSPGRIQQFVPIDGGSRYYEATYSALWAAIGTHQPFNGTCQCDQNIDNAMGISWNISIAPGASVRRSHLTLLSAGDATSCGPTPVSIGISPLTAANNQDILFSARAGIHQPFAGTMTFTLGEETGAIVCSAAMYDVATSCVHTLAPGNYSVIARYGGDAFNAPGCSPPQTMTVVNDAADILTTIAIQAESLFAEQGRPAQIKAKVTQTGAGSVVGAAGVIGVDGFVTFAYGDRVLGRVPIESGEATLTTVFAGGAFPITVTYSGDAQNITSEQTATIDVSVPDDGLFYGGFDFGPQQQ